MTTIGALDQEWNEFCMDPKRLIVKVVASIRCNDWPNRPFSRHLGSLLGVIELTVLCAFMQSRISFMLKSRRLYYTSSQGSRITCLFCGYVTNYLLKIQLQNNLHCSSIPLRTTFKPLFFLIKSTYFHCFPFSYLSTRWLAIQIMLLAICLIILEFIYEYHIHHQSEESSVC